MTKETSMSTIQERVAKGAAWLDQVRPGWRDAINLQAFTLSSLTNCILGQVFAAEVDDDLDAFTGFNVGVGVYCRSTKDYRAVVAMHEMGFIAGVANLPVEEVSAELDRMEAEWRRVIHQSLPVADHAPTRETSNV